MRVGLPRRTGIIAVAMVLCAAPIFFSSVLEADASATPASTATARSEPGAPQTAVVYPASDVDASVGSGPASVTLPVARGLLAKRLTGRLTSTLDAPLRAQVLVGNRVVAGLPAGSHNLDVALLASDLISGPTGPASVTVSIRVLDSTHAWTGCTDSTQAVTLSDLSLLSVGAATAPTTVATFFDATVSDITVAVPRAAGDLEQAALQAVASLTHRYGQSGTDTAVVTLISGEPTPQASPTGRRVLSLRSGSGPTATSISAVAGVPTLTMTGSPAGLASAVTALDSDQIVLGDAASTSGLTATPQRPNALTAPLNTLGVTGVLRLQGYGRSTTYLGVHQAMFGGAVQNARVHLVGTATPVPRAVQARFSVYWNGYLLGSTQIASGIAKPLDMNLDVPSSQIQRDNGLTVQLDALPDRGSCRSAGLPIEVDLDTTRSAVSVTRGQSLVSGFERFPQVLSGQLPVAIGTANAPADLLGQAAHYVSAMQRTTAVPLRVAIVSPAALVSGASKAMSGLLVGATPAQVTALQAPLRLGSFRQIDTATSPFGVGVDGAFAALQAFQSGSRDLIVAAAWAPGGDQADAATLLDRLATTADSRVGWSALTMTLLVTTPRNPPTQLDGGSLVPQAQTVAERSAIPIGVWLAILALALVVVARVVAVRRRLRRVRKYVDAEERALAASADKPPDGRHVADGGSQPM